MRPTYALFLFQRPKAMVAGDEINWFEWNDTTKSLVLLCYALTLPLTPFALPPYQALAVGIMCFIFIPNMFFSLWAKPVSIQERARRRHMAKFKNI